MTRPDSPSRSERPMGLQLRSHLAGSGELTLSLERTPVSAPAVGEVLVRVEAAPLNPSDLVLLFGGGDLSTARSQGDGDARRTTLTVPPEALPAMAGRIDMAMPVGNEGAGVVIEAGEGAEALLGRTVALYGGGMYGQYRTLPAQSCIVLPDDVTPAEGAASFVNPLTALSMVETMRREGQSGLVHTAAASNLGQMLNRLCLKDEVPLVNIVRSPAQAAILREIGARYVCDSSEPDFKTRLADAIYEAGATLAFDAIGGGPLASQILSAMETAALRALGGYSGYGSNTYKQVYIYGALDRSPTQLNRTFGMTWGVGGWLLSPFLQKIGPARSAELRARVAAEIKTTFASRYTQTVSLADLLRPDILERIGRMATGEKFLLTPQ